MSNFSRHWSTSRNSVGSDLLTPRSDSGQLPETPSAKSHRAFWSIRRSGRDSLYSGLRAAGATRATNATHAIAAETQTSPRLDTALLHRSHRLHPLHTYPTPLDGEPVWQRGVVDDKDRSEAAQVLQALIDAVDRGELTAESPVEWELLCRLEGAVAALRESTSQS